MLGICCFIHRFIGNGSWVVTFFCKIARRSKALGPRCHRALRMIFYIAVYKQQFLCLLMYNDTSCFKLLTCLQNFDSARRGLQFSFFAHFFGLLKHTFSKMHIGKPSNAYPNTFMNYERKRLLFQLHSSFQASRTLVKSNLHEKACFLAQYI